MVAQEGGQTTLPDREHSTLCPKGTNGKKPGEMIGNRDPRKEQETAILVLTESKGKGLHLEEQVYWMEPGMGQTRAGRGAARGKKGGE